MEAAKARARRAFAQLFVGLQRAKVDVLPRHFYSSIPDVNRLRATDRWRARLSMVDVAGADPAEQLTFLRQVVTPDITARLSAMDIFAEACRENGAGGYGPVEAAFFYAFVRSRRPRKIVQVGAGVSTSVALRAAADAAYQPEIVAVDPYPTAFLREAPVRLIQAEAQDVPLHELTSLEEGDLLFIDSTHTVKTDSEVNRLVLEVLPRLGRNVFVHFHDIYFPYDYQRDILNPPLFFWSESTLVHAFLVGNGRYRIATSLSMLHYSAPRELQALLPGYQPAPKDDGLDAIQGPASAVPNRKAAKRRRFASLFNGRGGRNRASRERPPGLHFPSSLYLSS